MEKQENTLFKLVLNISCWYMFVPFQYRMYSPSLKWINRVDRLHIFPTWGLFIPKAVKNQVLMYWLHCVHKRLTWNTPPLSDSHNWTCVLEKSHDNKIVTLRWKQFLQDAEDIQDMFRLNINQLDWNTVTFIYIYMFKWGASASHSPR